jgi:ABC-type transporter MlaC component
MKASYLPKIAVGFLLIAFVLSCVSAPHPNLAAAQQYVQQAIDKVTAAQSANNYDMQGHAAKAKSLMEQAIQEIQLAGRAANSN